MEQPVPGRSLDLVPIEIWALCWTLCSRRQIRRLSLVCKLFRSISLPFLFKDQSFNVAAMCKDLSRDNINWVERLHHLHRMAIRVERLAEPPFASLITSWKVIFGTEAPVISQHKDIENIHLLDDMRIRVLHTFCKTLHRYPKLSSLDIQRNFVDTAFLMTLVSLPELKHLKFHIPDKSPELYSGKILTMTSESLQSLDLSRDTLLLDGFSREISFPNLVSLSIGTVRDTELLFTHIVDRFPHLELLAIDSIQDTSPFPDLPRNCFPKLCSLTGPPSMIEALAPNRPISRAVMRQTWRMDHLVPIDDSKQARIALSRSSVPVTSLVLPGLILSLGLLSSLADLFPDLRELTLTPARGGPGGRIGSCCQYFRTEETVEADRRYPLLCEETAFDDLPVDELSDAEEEAEAKVERTITAPRRMNSGHIEWECVKTLIKWMSFGSFTLPPNIEVLHVDGSLLYEGVCLDDKYRALAGLTRDFPTLREVRLLSSGWTWIRLSQEESSTLWKADRIGCVRILLPEETSGDRLTVGPCYDTSRFSSGRNSTMFPRRRIVLSMRKVSFRAKRRRHLVRAEQASVT
ncbi:hypothetical protein R3P38DRAFT_2661653 [Favolaschia claudopus]|uniref:F-box domain-containing protein n=1 Tax=Favolaschia claudopus TaxID=2862362 RepID=A0AAV9ZM72_9AGAR